MAANLPRRKVSNTPSRNTLLPRRNPAVPGMGGSTGFWRGLPGSGGEGDGNYPMPRRRPTGDGRGPRPTPGQTPPIFDRSQMQQVPGIRHMLEQMGLGGGVPEGPAGFGFNTQQRIGIGDELARIQAYLANHPYDPRTHGQGPPQLHIGPNAGVGQALQQWEQQIGMHPGNVGTFGAGQHQQDMFRQALGWNPPPIGSGGGGQGGPGPQHMGQAQQVPYPQLQAQQVPVPQQIPPYGQLGHDAQRGGPPMPADPTQFPGYYSPGHRDHGPPQQPPQIPWYGQLGHDAPPGPYGPPPMQGPPMQPPGMQSPAYMNPAMAAAQAGAMPPFVPGGTDPAAAAAGGGRDPWALDFQQAQLPSWNPAVQAMYGQIPGQPQYLSGAGLASQQGYMNQLRQGLAGLQGQYGQIAPEYNLGGRRIVNDYNQAHASLAESLAARGIYGSGITGQDFTQQQADYNRQLQDLQRAAQQQATGVFGQASDLFGATEGNLYDLYRQEALAAAQNPYTPTGKGPMPRRKPKKKA